VHDWAGIVAWEQRREELVREAERRRLVRELRGGREARYRRRGLREWRLDAASSLEVRGELSRARLAEDFHSAWHHYRAVLRGFLGRQRT
jgi:hypothetical protein